ncbi:hypothetical protein [Stenotrophobium rhamnosiphilum]|uniref:PepSY domain-containing protein n=1 Tax=Stenotrophobium rhamnosiphilum TaxID=2029166 RepID=A0A2T5MHQ1_9GAMM|nr:hypothetical protein [Stenotrophobium rhamnosiphilum]PTU32103.1 hypothetical protein CJD38_05385 [Stenotrophobium rhamnosiphilum]
MRTRRYILVVLLGGLVFQSAFADPGRGHRRDDDREEQQRPSAGRMSPSEAAAKAQRNNGGGKVLAVEPTGTGYRVKLLQRGDVNIVFVPAD